MMESHSSEASSASELQLHLTTTGFQKISICGLLSLLFFFFWLVAPSTKLWGAQRR